MHKNKLTHTDLKPENILFINSDYVMEYNPDMVSVPYLLKYCQKSLFVPAAV